MELYEKYVKLSLIVIVHKKHYTSTVFLYIGFWSHLFHLLIYSVSCEVEHSVTKGTGLIVIDKYYMVVQ